MRNRIQFCSFLPLLTLAAASLQAEEWTSWRGPYQNGYSPQTGLIDTWSPEGENLVWRQDFIARSTPVVMGGRVFVNGRAGTGIHEQAVIAAFDAGTGEPLWENRYNLYLTTVAMNRVGWASLTGDPETGYTYAQLVSGLFLCHDRDGNLVWSRSLKEEHGRFEGYGGRTASPVIDEDLIIVNMNNGSWGNQGIPRHRYYAFDKRTGAVQWMSTPGGTIYDRNTQSIPIVTVISNQRLLITGNADGHIYALQARTGKKVWGFNLSKRGINSSPVVDDQGRVFISHSEENIDEGTLGRVLAIDGTLSGDITNTGELWRWNRNKAGFPSPTIHDGRLYVVNNSGNLAAVDTETGEVFWELSIGTVGKSSPVWADGKLYLTETNGNVHILRPGPDGPTALDHDELEVENGFENVGTSFDNRTYIVRAEFDQQQTERLSGRFGAWTQVRDFQAVGFEALAPRTDLTSMAAFAYEEVSGDLTAEARIRVFPPLPWTEDFSGGKQGYWIGGGRYDIAEEDGDSVLVKPVAERGLLRSPLLLGPPSLGNYTIQADVRNTQKGRRRSDSGLINSGYILDMLGIHQRLQIRSWSAQLRVEQKADYEFEMDRWYTMKLQVESDGDTATIRGKVWPRDEEEPAEWTLTAEDPHPIRSGSPGLLGYSPSVVSYDNVRITSN